MIFTERNDVMKNLIVKKNDKKGFTLAELLIVVAIIAVLVAVAIPVFTSQLNRSRQATNAANLRSAYAEAQVKYMETSNDGAVEISFTGAADYSDSANDAYNDLPDIIKNAAPSIKDGTNYLTVVYSGGVPSSATITQTSSGS